VSEERTTTADSPPDVGDVVDGPIGSAWLRDPATSGPKGSDLDGWPVIDTAESPEDASSSPERQEPDRVGVDWERTKREH
jgi:hypothetical protein